MSSLTALQNKVGLEIQRTSTLLKYLNCLERFLFIDNQLMPRYDEIFSPIKDSDKGVILFFKKLRLYLQENNLNEIANFKPLKNEVKQGTNLNCVVLEQYTIERPNDEDKTFVVVAVPEIDRIFHFKMSSPLDLQRLSEISISTFFYHPQLPRIKIQTRNITSQEKIAKLENLRFLFTNINDGNNISSGIFYLGKNLDFKNLIPDPNFGVQNGTLATYYVSPIMVSGFEASTENAHQVKLRVLDWQGNTDDIYITTSMFRDCFGSNPNDVMFTNGLYARVLIFQELGDKFKHALVIEKSSKYLFDEESAFAHIRFRINCDAKEVNLDKLIKGVKKKNNLLTYYNENFDDETIQIYERLKVEKKLPLPQEYLKLLKYKKYLEYNPIFNDIYVNNLNISSFILPIRVVYISSFQIHKRLLTDPVERLMYFTLRIRQDVFCTYCKKYNQVISTNELPSSCPICGAKVLVALKSPKDLKILLEYQRNDYFRQYTDKVYDYYHKLGGLYLRYGSKLYWVTNSTNKSIKYNVRILRDLEPYDTINEFFRHLYKILVALKDSEESLYEEDYESQEN